MQIEITDVFLRDGLQDVDVVVPTADKLETAARLMAAGVRRLEVASFVNPKKVPQMADAEAVFAGLPVREDVAYTSLALNGRGIQRAVDAGAEHVAVVTSASQAHSNANAGQSIEEALAGLGEVVAKFPGTDFFAGISTAFTCPFEGDIAPEHLLRVVRAFKDHGHHHHRPRRHPGHHAHRTGHRRGGLRPGCRTGAGLLTAPAQRARPGAGYRQRSHRRSESPASTAHSAATADAPSPPEPPATSQPKNSSATCTPQATTPASTRHSSPRPSPTPAIQSPGHPPFPAFPHHTKTRHTHPFRLTTRSQRDAASPLGDKDVSNPDQPDHDQTPATRRARTKVSARPGRTFAAWPTFRPFTTSAFLAVLLIAALTDNLPDSMLAGFAATIILGGLFIWIGNTVPVLRDFGLPTILCTFVPSILIFAGVMPENLIAVVQNFVKGYGFLDFFVVTIIAGSILGMPRALLLKAGPRFIVPLVGCLIATFSRSSDCSDSSRASASSKASCSSPRRSWLAAWASARCRCRKCTLPGPAAAPQTSWATSCPPSSWPTSSAS